MTKPKLSNRPAPPRPSTLGDQLDRTAVQVRYRRPGRYDLLVHSLARNRFVPSTGRLYTTDCQEVMAARDGAVLTTGPVTCSRCLGTSLAPKDGGPPRGRNTP